MPATKPSDILTHGIRIGVTAFYLPEESDPDEGSYLFGYRIVITNEGDEPATLLSRHWVIIDGDGGREDVRGPGVVGQQPRLEPGQTFAYTSFCPLSTIWGTMEGEFRMQRDNGDHFDAPIARFFLKLPQPTPAPSASEVV